MKRMTKVVQEKLVMMLQSDFDFDISDRISVISDLEHYNADVDRFVHAQKIGKIPNFYEVYWDNEWIMDFHEGDPPRNVYTQFLKGFGKAYVQGKVRLNKSLAEVEAANDLEALVKRKKIEKFQEQISKAFEVGTTDKNPATQEEIELAEQITKSIQEARSEKNKITA